MKEQHIKTLNTIKGVIFVTIFAVIASFISHIPALKQLSISPLVIGILLGVLWVNLLHHRTPASWQAGVQFCAKKVLRFAIVFYGFRISYQQVAEIGPAGLLVSALMLSSTFLLGSYLGQKLFKLDRDTSMLCAIGASVCGAAAVLAAEPVLKAESHKAALAVSMVVLFGTIAMFLYPALYSSSLLQMSPRDYGIYTGGSVHEVAQVVAASSAVNSEASAAAVIVKMTRVILLAPTLIILGFYLSLQNKKRGGDAAKIKVVIPWFAVYFLAVIGVNSLGFIPSNAVNTINQVDTFLLTMAMSALGLGTHFAKFKGLGLAPVYTAGLMFLWLVVGGYFITKLALFIFA